MLEQQFHFDDLALGVLLSAFLWVYTFLQPLAGWAADRFGPRRTLLLGVFASSIITILTGFVGSFLALLSLRLLLGIAQTPNFVTGAKVTASNWFEQSQRARSASLWIAGARLGTILTLPLAAGLYVALGWQWAFFGPGLLGLFWCLLWFKGYQDRPDFKTKIRNFPNIREHLPVLVSPLGLGLTLASFGQGYIAYYLNFWLPSYLVKQQKFTVLASGFYSTLPFIAAMTTILLVGGVLSDYRVKRGASPVGLRSNLFTMGMIGVAAMMVVTAYAPNALFAVTALTLVGAAWGVATPSLWVALVEATPKQVTASMGGIQNFGGNLGGIVVSILTGYIVKSTGSFFLAVIAGSTAALLAALSALVFVRKSGQQQDLQLSEFQPTAIAS